MAPIASPRMAISLWDFSWFTQAGPGEPFNDLDAAFAQLVERGFNTVRICAMPFLLFSGRVEPTEHIVCGMGGEYGQRTRWYNVRGGYPLKPLHRLEALFDTALRHGVRVIVSSWEYQQSPVFVTTDEWHRALARTPYSERATVMASSQAALVSHLQRAGLDAPIAYVEVHNEVDLSTLVPPSADPTSSHYARLRKPLQEAMAAFSYSHPAVPVTYSVGEPWPAEYADLPAGDVTHVHLYAYGVLGALYNAIGLGHGTEPRPRVTEWPTPTLTSMLRPGAPPRGQWQPSAGWQNDATGVNGDLFYVHDWVDPNKWDLWLYEHYQEHRLAMRQKLEVWVDATAALATSTQTPAVIGEGVVGYTPLNARMEEDAVGKDLAEYVVRRALAAGFAGSVLTSNAAPHHPMWWTDRDWMRRLNTEITTQ